MKKLVLIFLSLLSLKSFANHTPTHIDRKQVRFTLRQTAVHCHIQRDLAMRMAENQMLESAQFLCEGNKILKQETAFFPVKTSSCYTIIEATFSCDRPEQN